MRYYFSLDLRIPLLYAIVLSYIVVSYICLAMVIEYYVYEITITFKSGSNEMRTRVVVKLIRIDNETFRVELIEAEPEQIKTVVKYRYEVFNGIYRLSPLKRGGYILYESLSGALLPLYVDLNTIRAACEKADDVERIVKELLNAIVKQRPDVRELLNKLLDPEGDGAVISIFVGDTLQTSGLYGMWYINNADYSLTSTCRGNVNTFKYYYRFVTERIEHNYECESTYSNTGWLIYGKHVSGKVMRDEGTRMSTSTIAEMKLVETSNIDLKSHTQIVSQQVLEDFVTNPQVITLLLILAVAAIAVMIKKK